MLPEAVASPIEIPTANPAASPTASPIAIPIAIPIPIPIPSSISKTELNHCNVAAYSFPGARFCASEHAVPGDFSSSFSKIDAFSSLAAPLFWS